MSEPEPETELDANVTANGSGCPIDNGPETVSGKKDEELSGGVVDGGKDWKKEKDDCVKMTVEVADRGKERKEEKNDGDVKMTEIVDGGIEHKEEKDDDVKMTIAEDAEKKDDDVKMADAEEANVTVGKKMKMAEADDSRKEEVKDVRDEEAKDMRKEEAEDTKVVGDMKKEEAEDMIKGEAKGMKKEEAEDMKKEEDKDTKNEEVEDMKEEVGDMTEEESEDMKKEDVVQDIEMEEREVEDKKTGEDKDVTEEKDNADIEKKVEESEEAEGEATGSKKKLIRGQKVSEKKEAKEKKESEKKNKEASTPVASSIERPVRERKSVERLVEALERESVKPFIIEKGRGTPLKDIPNVTYKISKKKPADLKLLHQTLFGRVGKAINYKNHILQFSGFVWHESEDKQKTKIKEKLDKCVKDALLDFCDLFDIPVLKAKSNARKEELVAMLLDFMVAPHATTDVILSEQEQSSKSKKRKRGAKGSGSKSSRGLLVKRSRKENIMSKDTPKTKAKGTHESEDEGEHGENVVPAKDDTPENSESKEKEIESDEASEDDENDDSGKDKQEMKSPKRGGSADAKKSKVSAGTKKISSPTTAKSPTKSSFAEPEKKISSPTTAKSPTKSSSGGPKKISSRKNLTKSSSSKCANAEDKTNGGTKVFSRKQKDVEPTKKKIASSKTDPKEKASGKKVSKNKVKSKEHGEPGPSKEELKKTICEILSKVDFNTATFTDILKELASYYGMDLTPRKAAIKLMIQEELTKLAEEDEDDDEEEEDGGDK